MTSAGAGLGLDGGTELCRGPGAHHPHTRDADAAASTPSSTWAATSTTSAPRRRRDGDGHALAAARAVADVAHRVDGLAGAAGAHHDTEPVEVGGPAAGRGERGVEDRLGLRHPSRSAVAAGELAALGPTTMTPALAQRRHVVDGGGVAPHLGVHRRRHDDRCRGGEQGRAEEVVRESRGHLRQGVRRRGRHDHEVGRLAERDVTDPATSSWTEVVTGLRLIASHVGSPTNRRASSVGTTCTSCPA